MSRSTRGEKKLRSSGTSSETGPVDSEIKPCDVLHSNISSYKLQHFRFTGCFSNVAVCRDLDTKELTAIKIFKKTAGGSQEPNRELAMLKKIHGLSPVNIVRFFEDFEHKGHTCLAFELLDKNLHELLKERRGNTLSVDEIRPITQQLLSALESLKTVSVIHTNIKPQNIMLVDPQQPFRVKIIDFGSAITTGEVKRGDIMQPVGYRSPDVILGLPITEAVDIWSLGGVLATMYLGSLPFPQRCQYYLMKTMVETLGQPEDELLSDGTHTLLYFSPNTGSTKPAWRLKTADEYKAATGLPPQKHRDSSSSLGNLLQNPAENQMNVRMFASLLLKMLHLNPQKRITPSEALSHPFITQSQLDDDDDDEDSLMAESEEEDFTSVSDLSDEDEAAPLDRADSALDVTSASSDGASVTSLMSSLVDNVSAADQQEEVSAGGVELLPADGDAGDEVPDAATGPAADPQEEVSAGGVELLPADGDAGDEVPEAATGPAADPQEEVSAGGEELLPADGDAGDEVPEAATGPAADPQEEVSAGGVEILHGDEDAGDEVPDAATGPAANSDSAVTSPPPDSHLGSDGASSPSRKSRRRRIKKFFGRMFRALCCCCCRTDVNK